MKKILLLVVISLLSACGSIEQVEKSKLRTTTVESTVSVKNSTQTDDKKEQIKLAEEFMGLYINQPFELEILKDKEARLKELAGDSTLDNIVQATIYLQKELFEYQKTNQLSTGASVTLVEKKVKDITVYQRESAYFVDVSYVENSPAYSGSFDRRRQFTFKIDNNKIVQFGEVLYK